MHKFFLIFFSVFIMFATTPVAFGAVAEGNPEFTKAEKAMKDAYKDFQACSQNCGAQERKYLDAVNALQAVNNASVQGQTQALAEQGIKICDYLPCVGKIYSSKDPISYAAELIITNFTRIASAFAVLAFIIGGGMILTSLGEDSQMTKGKNIMIGSAIGLVIIFSAYVIVSFIEQIFYSLGK